MTCQSSYAGDDEVHVDFEQAMINAIRKLQAVGLANRYKDEQAFKLVVHRACVLIRVLMPQQSNDDVWISALNEETNVDDTRFTGYVATTITTDHIENHRINNVWKDGITF